jgi:RNA polymerase sigma-70 factor (ECF subfamily)
MADVTAPPPAASRHGAAGPDADTASWLDALTATGAVRDDAVARLHDLMLRGARFELHRRRRATGAPTPHELEDLATQAADDALVAVLAKLPTFRGDSRFTTWAYKFALLEASVKARRRTWEGREIPLEDDAWMRLSDRGASPGDDAETADLLTAVSRAIAEGLTPHQRAVLVALALNGVPIDVLAERLSTTRGALYKTLHDARVKLRKQLAAQGHDIERSFA